VALAPTDAGYAVVTGSIYGTAPDLLALARLDPIVVATAVPATLDTSVLAVTEARYVPQGRDDEFLLAWADSSTRLKVRRFDAHGVPRGPVGVLAMGGPNAGRLEVVPTETGALAAWDVPGFGATLQALGRIRHRRLACPERLVRGVQGFVVRLDQGRAVAVARQGARRRCRRCRRRILATPLAANRQQPALGSARTSCNRTGATTSCRPRPR
jgi:hypothetical protein